MGLTFDYLPTKDEHISGASIYADALPKGRLWEAFSVGGTVSYAVSGGIGAMLALVIAYLQYLRTELNPYAATDLIQEWEESVGLPDPCTLSRFQTIEERRAQVILRLRHTPLVKAGEIEAAVLFLTGFMVKILPRRSSVNYLNGLFDGLSNFDDAPFSNTKADRFTFDVYINYDEENAFDGDSDFDGEYLFDGRSRPGGIECLIEKLKPANSLAVYHYSSELYERAIL